MKAAHDSLSVVLPVCNDPEALSRRVGELLEFLPELTREFEILIVDQGSTDQTEEVAHEWALEYPQVRALRLPQGRRQRRDVLQLGLDQGRGELLLVYDAQMPICATQLRRIWELRENRPLLLARTATALEPSLIQRLAAWARRVPGDEPVPAANPQLLRRTPFGEPRDKVHQVSLPDTHRPFSGDPHAPKARSTQL